ncbi:MAG: PKD domain-containing protein [candidate division Zixibacteria bacterium]|nr:PKD domain-containing protein [candidate division Zixibacteria bacterium]
MLTPNNMKPSALHVSRRIGVLLGAGLVMALTIFSACDELITNETVVILELKSEFVAVCPDGTVSDTGCAGCAPFTVTFQDVSKGIRAEWSWNFGDGNISTETDPTHTFDSSGLYRVSLRITYDSSGIIVSDIEIKNRFIFVGEPVTGFSLSDSLVDSGKVIIFFPEPDSAFSTSWLWVFGDGDSSTLRKPAHVYSSAGVFDVKLVTTCFTDSALADSAEFIDSGLVSIIPVPATPDITIVPRQDSLCVPFQMAFQDSSQVAAPAIINSWFWEADNGQTSSNPDFRPTFFVPGDHRVKLTVQTDLGGSATKSVTITGVPQPSAAFNVSETFRCNAALQPFTVTFTDQSVGNIEAHQWDFGDGGSSSIANPVHDYTKPGLYDVTLRVLGSCFPLGIPAKLNTIVKSGLILLADTIHTDSVSFGITPATGDTNSVFTMTDNTNGHVTGWSWIFNDTGQIGASSSENFRFTVDGTYVIKMYVKNTCMTDSVFATKTVIVSTAP